MSFIASIHDFQEGKFSLGHALDPPSKLEHAESTLHPMRARPTLCHLHPTLSSAAIVKYNYSS